jgi:phosphatidate cytidylyltransferase
VSGAHKASAKSDLPTRTIAAVAMIAVALAAIYLGGWPFSLLVALAAALMLFEWCGMHKLARVWPMIGTASLAINLLVVPQLYPMPGDGSALYWFGAALLLGVLLGLAARSLRLGWGYVYVAVPAVALLVLSGFGWPLVLWAMVVTWATDIFAYFAGRAIGGPKLAPRISPNKTLAGLVGGMAGAGAAGAAAVWALGPSWPFAGAGPFLYGGAAMGLVAQLGDLYESAVKRRAGVKDSGTILPGHGGVLDRLDGLLPVALATLVMLLVAMRPA